MQAVGRNGAELAGPPKEDEGRRTLSPLGPEGWLGAFVSNTPIISIYV